MKNTYKKLTKKLTKEEYLYILSGFTFATEDEKEILIILALLDAEINFLPDSWRQEISDNHYRACLSEVTTGYFNSNQDWFLVRCKGGDDCGSSCEGYNLIHDSCHVHR